jgi:Ca2+-binding EF-hand superfamily protein
MENIIFELRILKIFHFFQDTLFSFIDLDRNGVISASEAAKAISLMNKSLGTQYDATFISQLDKNRDGLVDLNEFKMGFSKAHKLDYLVTAL